MIFHASIQLLLGAANHPAQMPAHRSLVKMHALHEAVQTTFARAAYLETAGMITLTKLR